MDFFEQEGSGPGEFTSTNIPLSDSKMFFLKQTSSFPLKKYNSMTMCNVIILFSISVEIRI
jgi:hypothetical protein